MHVLSSTHIPDWALVVNYNANCYVKTCTQKGSNFIAADCMLLAHAYCIIAHVYSIHDS